MRARCWLWPTRPILSDGTAVATVALNCHSPLRWKGSAWASPKIPQAHLYIVDTWKEVEQDSLRHQRCGRTEEEGLRDNFSDWTMLPAAVIYCPAPHLCYRAITWTRPSANLRAFLSAQEAETSKAYRGDVIMIMHAREALKDRIQLKKTEDAVSLHQFSLLYSTLLPTLWRYFALHIQRRKTRTYRTPKQNSSCLICLPLFSARTQHCSELVLDCHSSWGLRSLSCHSLSLSSWAQENSWEEKSWPNIGWHTITCRMKLMKSN